MLRSFRVMGGSFQFRGDNRVYKRGEVVESESDLASMFPGVLVPENSKASKDNSPGELCISSTDEQFIHAIDATLRIGEIGGDDD